MGTYSGAERNKSSGLGGREHLARLQTVDERNNAVHLFRGQALDGSHFPLTLQDDVPHISPGLTEGFNLDFKCLRQSWAALAIITVTVSALYKKGRVVRGGYGEPEKT